MSSTQNFFQLAEEVEDRARQLSLLVDFVDLNSDPSESECNIAGMIRWQVQDLFDRINTMTMRLDAVKAYLNEADLQSPAAHDKEAA